MNVTALNPGSYGTLAKYIGTAVPSHSGDHLGHRCVPNPDPRPTRRQNRESADV